MVERDRHCNPTVGINRTYLSKLEKGVSHSGA